MRLLTTVVLCTLALCAALPTGTSRAGNLMPLLGCGAVPGDTTLTAFTVEVANHGVVDAVRATEIVPFAQDGYPAFPFVGVDCPPGYSAVPDSIPGAVLILGPVYGATFGEFVLRAHTRAAPYELRLYQQGSSHYSPSWNTETCSSAATPARPATWGRVKDLYR